MILYGIDNIRDLFGHKVRAECVVNLILMYGQVMRNLCCTVSACVYTQLSCCSPCETFVSQNT